MTNWYELSEAISQKKHSIKDKKVMAGFDGFVDAIYRAVESTCADEGYAYFDKIKEFGAYLMTKEGKSCSVELVEKLVKFGGNMPIMSNALGRLGFSVDCMGALGAGDIHPTFAPMSESCSLYPVSEPGMCTAIEFNDGKVMFGNNNSIDIMNWDTIKASIGLERLKELFDRSNLIALLNWGELKNTSAIWKGIIEEILPQAVRDKSRIVFTDLSDCSKRTNEEIMAMSAQLKDFNNKFHTVLSLNENEFLRIYGVFHRQSEMPELRYDNENVRGYLKYVLDKLEVDVLLLHTPEFSYYMDAIEFCYSENYYITSPVLSTGGGDNFNAGFCAGVLMGLSPRESLILGGATGSYYVKYGVSPDLDNVTEFIAGIKTL